MAYVNVAEWKTDQVCEWLKGLDTSTLPYIHSFMNHGVNGQQLLSLGPDDLEYLGVSKLGHQEIILQAVEYLRNFHYELDRENLQLLALRLSCQAHSLRNELLRQTDSKPVATQTLSDVAAVIAAVKPLVRWLDRPPFGGQLEYNDKKVELMKLSLEMATCAQRDRFAEKPIEEIRTTCEKLAKLADHVIQDVVDPMILQPASLDLATLKKRPGDELGFYILPSFHGSHQIAEIKFGSVAHQSGKMEEGDEIVQVNYQTVVGWERKNLLELFRESPGEILLTLKRRPRHTKVYGQIYIKPYRLPSNKKTPYTTRWQHNLPSPRPELLTIPDFTMPLPRHQPKDATPKPNILDTVNMLDTMASDSSDSDVEAEAPLSIRLYSAKPRNLVQRRATITGVSPTAKYCIDLEQFWQELKLEHKTAFQIRDKAVSCADGLDTVQSNVRPHTCLGIEANKKKNDQTDNRKVQFQEITNDRSIENLCKKMISSLDSLETNDNETTSVSDPEVPDNKFIFDNSSSEEEGSNGSSNNNVNEEHDSRNNNCNESALIELENSKSIGKFEILPPEPPPRKFPAKPIPPRPVNVEYKKDESFQTRCKLNYNSTIDNAEQSKTPSGKYEPFNEKFGIDMDRTIDSIDGFACLRQSPDQKNKEKSVVNRAKMVARSIGLHGSINKSNNSPKTGRKRNVLLAKKRNVAVKDIKPVDLEAWLTYRSRGAGGAWARAWFVLKCSSLYRFKSQDSTKADCLIALPGFTASQANEVKSRKYAFKVYHTGTVFYFAADTDDSLGIWLDAVNKGTLGVDAHNRNSGLFSETDESDGEVHTSKNKTLPNVDKSFGSLKKNLTKDSGYDISSGASLDRKYLRFLGARHQNLPVPTAQFRSYRRVLPTSTPNKKDSNQNQSEFQMTIAGSTFYGLSASQSASDMSSSNQDMGDYRRTTDNRYVNNRVRGPEELQNFITLEAFMLGHQENDHHHNRVPINSSAPPRVTLLTSDHVHVPYRNLDTCTNNNVFNDTEGSSSRSNASYNYTKSVCRSESYASNEDDNRTWDRRNTNIFVRFDDNKWPGMVPEDNHSNLNKKRSTRNECKLPGYSGSSSDLTTNTSETLQRAKKEASVSRKGSFNLDKNWMDSLKRNERRNTIQEKNRLKHVAQYQPPPIPSSPFEQEGMRAAFEMHLDKAEQVQKANRFKNLFNPKSQHKSNTLVDTSKEGQQKTLLGSPRLHRAFFRDKTPNQNQCFNDWVPAPNPTTNNSYPREVVPGIRSTGAPPTLPYIPPPTSPPPPPDYPGLEYPPVFEPGTYSLSDPTLLQRCRNKNIQKNVE